MTAGNNGIYRLTVPGGKLEKVSDLPANYKDLYGRGPAISLTADGHPAMMVTTGVGQIYSLHWKQ